MLPTDIPQADLIFVLAGRHGRKVLALELYRAGVAPRVVLSVSRFEIRRFSALGVAPDLNLLKLAAPIAAASRHFFVCVQREGATAEYVGRGRFGTLSEIQALAKWLSTRPQIRHLLVVSGAAHLPRVGLCCRHLLSPHVKVSYAAAAEETNTRGALIEAGKRLLYRAMLRLERARKMP